ncbi:MAG: tetratricopeptide repeat protein [Planctomycetota bacterium]|jgi:tetratricopeptide (TPR) repeat protein
MKPSHDKLRVFLIYMVLALATFAAYEPVRNNDFVSYDDHSYVAKNPHVTAGITPRSVSWAFTGSHFHMWHPITSLSHMLDCQLFGLNPFWHHLTSLLLHIANSLILFSVLKRTTGVVWPGAFVAAVFALHPLQVESVAWAAERKNVLSGFFWMLTIAAYIRYARHPRTVTYLLVILVFSLALMAKPVTVTLPFVLLLLDYWPLRRFRYGSQSIPNGLTDSKPAKTGYQKSPLSYAIREKIPFFVLSAALSIITFFVVRAGGAVATTDRLPLNYRLANAPLSYVRYIGKMIYPTRLAVFYPHPAGRLPLWLPMVCLLILAAVSVGIIYAGRRRPYLATGWLWYLGTLVPVIGLVQAGGQAMADRYAYLPLIGIFIMIAWGAAELFGRARYGRIFLAIAVPPLLTILLICTRLQVRYWKNDNTLFKHALEVTQNNPIALNSYGCVLFENNQLDEAVACFQDALRIDPQFSRARSNLGKVFFKQGKFEKTIASFDKVLRLKQNSPDAYYYMGLAYAQLGKPNQAISSYYEALRLEPDHKEAHYRLGLAMTREGKYNRAIDHFNQALRSKPDWFEVHDKIGLAYLQLRNYEQLISHWTRAAELKPEAAEVHNNLAWVLATNKDTRVRDPLRAVKFAEKACQLTHYKKANTLDTLAAAYAAAGTFDQAVETVQKAIGIARSEGNKELTEQIQSRLQLYRAGRPYREK